MGAERKQAGLGDQLIFDERLLAAHVGDGEAVYRPVGTNLDRAFPPAERRETHVLPLSCLWTCSKGLP
jgi:hypothetical protein